MFSHQGLRLSQDSKSNAKARQALTSERYLAFQLGKEQYALPLLQVREVIEMSEPTPIPRTPNYFRGIINLRGQVISVLDLRAKLQFASIENGPKTAIIILDIDPQLFVGVIVDRVSSVLAFQSDDLSQPPNTMNGEDGYLTGVARREGKMTLILDIRAALNLEELRQIQSQQTTIAA